MCHHMTLEEWQLLLNEKRRRRGAAHDRGRADSEPEVELEPEREPERELIRV